MSETKKGMKRPNPLEVIKGVYDMYSAGYINDAVAKKNFDSSGITGYGTDFKEKYLKKNPDVSEQEFEALVAFLNSLGIKESEGKTKLVKVKQSGSENLGLLSAEKMEEIGVDPTNRDEYVTLITSIKSQIKTLQSICKKGRVSFAIPVIKPKATDEADLPLAGTQSESATENPFTA